MSSKIVYLHRAENFILDAVTTSDITKANVIVIGGASDRVDPHLFNQEIQDPNINPSIEVNLKSVQVFNKAMRLPNVSLIIGVGMGALISAAMAGGRLIQGVTNHDRNGLQRIKGKIGEYLVPTKHIQMMYLNHMNKNSYEILFHSLEKSTVYLGSDIPEAVVDSFVEPEYVLFKNLNKPVLAMMPDISTMRVNTRTVRMTNNLINKYLK